MIAQQTDTAVDEEGQVRTDETAFGWIGMEGRRMGTIDIAQSVGERISPTDSTVVEPRDGSDESKLGADAVFSILQNRRRRDVLRHLRRHGGTLTHGELAEFIAADENEKTVAELTSKERKRIYVALYQSHLPMMAEHGVIEFKRTGGTVKLTERAAQVENYLDVVHDDELKWWNYYLGLAVLGGFFYGAVSFLLGRDKWPSGLTVAGLVLATGVPALTQRNRLRGAEPAPSEVKQ